MVFSRQSLFWALGSPWERQSTLNPTDFILNHCCHAFPSAKRRFPPGKEKNSCSLENLLNPMICKERRWQATWVLLPGVLLSFGFSSFARHFWRHSALGRHGVIDSFLCDFPPATNYRHAEPQDVFNLHLTSFIYLAEVTHKKGDFFFPLVSKLVAHVH